MAVLGGCRCGAVRYELARDSLPRPYACHCLHCQTTSGGAFGLHALLPEAVLAATGPLVIYEHDGAAGLPSRQHVCAQCHTRIYNHNAAIPGMVILRAGTLDDSNLLEPVAHIWVKRKQAWVVIPEGVRNWTETPTPEEFAAAMPKAP